MFGEKEKWKSFLRIVKLHRSFRNKKKCHKNQTAQLPLIPNLLKQILILGK
jgi:hypothetical protein